MMQIVSVLIFIISAPSLFASTAPYTLETRRPSSDLKQLGEQFSVLLSLDVHPPYKFDLKQLPVARKIGAHLHRGDLKIQKTGALFSQHYLIEVPFQVVGHAQAPSSVLIPPLVLILVDGERYQPLVLEPFAVDIAAGLDLGSRAPGEMPELQGERLPPVISTRLWFCFFLLPLLAALALAAKFIWDAVILPAWEKYQRPFAKAKRELSNLSDADHEFQKVRCLHRAINGSAKATVLAGDLGRFFVDCPQYLSEEESFRAFFRYSNQLMFCAEHASIQRVDINRVVHTCAAIERRQ